MGDLRRIEWQVDRTSPQNPARDHRADVHLELRPPLWAQVWVVVFPFFLPFLHYVVRPERGGGSWILSGGMFVFAALLGWRLFQQAMLGNVDGAIVVRNFWRTHMLHREDVTEVSVERRTAATNSVVLRLRSGSTVRLDVTETPFLGPFLGRLERQASEVRDWVSGTRPSI